MQMWFSCVQTPAQLLWNVLLLSNCIIISYLEVQDDGPY